MNIFGWTIIRYKNLKRIHQRNRELQKEHIHSITEIERRITRLENKILEIEEVHH